MASGLVILSKYLKRVGMQERNLTYAVSRIHFSLLILIVMPLFCCKARMFGGNSCVLFLSTLIILFCVWIYINFNVMWIIYLLLDRSCGCMIYDLPACHHISNHHKTWSFLSKLCPSLATLPGYNPRPPACSPPLLHDWDPAAKNWIETTKRKRKKKGRGLAIMWSLLDIYRNVWLQTIVQFGT